MLVVWSRGDAESKLPTIGERYMVELQLPAHPVFGQRALQFKAKVVRVFRQENGRVMAAFESNQRRIKSIRSAAWAEPSNDSALVN